MYIPEIVQKSFEKFPEPVSAKDREKLSSLIVHIMREFPTTTASRKFALLTQMGSELGSDELLAKTVDLNARERDIVCLSMLHCGGYNTFQTIQEEDSFFLAQSIHQNLEKSFFTYTGQNTLGTILHLGSGLKHFYRQIVRCNTGDKKLDAFFLSYSKEERVALCEIAQGLEEQTRTCADVMKLLETDALQKNGCLSDNQQSFVFWALMHRAAKRETPHCVLRHCADKKLQSKQLERA